MQHHGPNEFIESAIDAHWSDYQGICERSVKFIVANSHRPIVIAGNGPSLAAIDYARLPKDAFIWRVNNFYFEDKYYLGRKVDALYMGGSPRVIQSFTNTLMTVLTRREYEVETFIGRTDNLFKINSSYFPVLDVKRAFITNRDVSNFMTLAHMPPGILPTSGILSIFAAISFGFKEIHLAGIDMYAGAARYAYSIGSNHAKIVGIKPGATGYFEAFHAQDSDIRGLNFALSIPGIKITTVCPTSPIAERIGLSDVLYNEPHSVPEKPEGYIRDFVPIPVVVSNAKKVEPPRKKSLKMTVLDGLEAVFPTFITRPAKKVLAAAGVIKGPKPKNPR